MKMTFKLILGLLIFLSFSSSYASSDSCDDWLKNTLEDKKNYGVEWVYSQIYAQATSSGCINGAKDNSEINSLYQALQSKIVNGKRLTDAHMLELQSRLFFAVTSELNAANYTCKNNNLDNCQIVEGLLEQVKFLEDSSLKSDSESINDARQPNNWRINADGDQIITGANLIGFASINCPNSMGGDSCMNSLKVIVKLLRASESMIQLVSIYNQTVIGQNKAFLTLRHSEWDQYFNVVSVQYPWELEINSVIYNRGRDDDALARFPQAPSKKLIFMHPSAGFEYISINGDNNVVGSVLLEVVGGEVWSWKDGKASNRWGASAAVSFAKVSGMDAVGYGVVLHTPIENASIGIVWRDGDNGRETGAFLNFDLAALFLEYKDHDLVKFLNR